MRFLSLWLAAVLAGIAATPPPSPAEVQSLLAEVRENALSYTQSLPNYVCRQITKRYVDPSGREAWKLEDTVEEQLSFSEQKESYKVIMINGRPVSGEASHVQSTGTTSTGEFGTVLREIFHPANETEFEWQKWAKRESRTMHVFTYRVRKPRYVIEEAGSHRTLAVGFHGEIFVDPESKSVMRMTMLCDDIPDRFPIDHVSLELDYQFVRIGGKQYVLPARCKIRLNEGRLHSWNDVTYLGYRKFGTESSISFDGAEIPQ